MDKLIIEAKREAYSTKDIYRTMTVAELKQVLDRYDDDTPIYLSHDNGYTFGGISEYDIEEVDCEEESDEEY